MWISKCVDLVIIFYVYVMIIQLESFGCIKFSYTIIYFSKKTEINIYLDKVISPEILCIGVFLHYMVYLHDVSLLYVNIQWQDVKI